MVCVRVVCLRVVCLRDVDRCTWFVRWLRWVRWLRLSDVLFFFLKYTFVFRHLEEQSHNKLDRSEVVSRNRTKLLGAGTSIRSMSRRIAKHHTRIRVCGGRGDEKWCVVW